MQGQIVKISSDWGAPAGPEHAGDANVMVLNIILFQEENLGKKDLYLK